MSKGYENLGYSLPSIIANLSPAVANARFAAITANVTSFELPVEPRSVVNQQELLCCVSCALGAAMEILNPGWPALAPLFHYYVTRYDEGGADADGFLYLDNGLASLTNVGICRNGLHHLPYTAEGAKAKPSPDAYADALTRRLGRRGIQLRYIPRSGLSNVAWIREQLNLGRPVVLAMQLPNSYPDSFLNSAFEWLDPDSSERSASGHCVLVTGYNDLRCAIHIQDSHGSGKFEKGCWWMGYRVADSSIVQDAYSLIP